MTTRQELREAMRAQLSPETRALSDDLRQRIKAERDDLPREEQVRLFERSVREAAVGGDPHAREMLAVIRASVLPPSRPATPAEIHWVRRHPEDYY